MKAGRGSFSSWVVSLAMAAFALSLGFSQAPSPSSAAQGDVQVVAFALARQWETRSQEGKKTEARTETEILPLVVIQQGRYVEVENDASDERHRGAVENLLKQFPTYQVLRWGVAQNQLRVASARQQLFQCSELVIGAAEPALKTDDFWHEQTVSDKGTETTIRISRPFLAVSGEASGADLRAFVGPRSALRRRVEEFFLKAAKEVAREKNFAFEPGPEEKLTYMHFFRLGGERLAVAKVWMRGPEKIFPILLFARVPDSGVPEKGEPELVANLASEEVLQGASGYDFIDAAELRGQPVVFVQYGTPERVEFIILEWRGGKLAEAFRGGGYGC